MTAMINTTVDALTAYHLARVLHCTGRHHAMKKKGRIPKRAAHGNTVTRGSSIVPSTSLSPYVTVSGLMRSVIIGIAAYSPYIIVTRKSNFRKNCLP